MLSSFLLVERGERREKERKRERVRRGKPEFCPTIKNSQYLYSCLEIYSVCRILMKI